MKLLALGVEPTETNPRDALFRHYEGLDFVGSQMSMGTVSLMKALEAHPSDRVLYGKIVTPYSELRLRSQNDEETPTWLKIGGLGMGHMIIRVRVPVEKRRFPNCWVEREVQTQEDGFRTVVEGLDYSCGWDARVGGVPIGLSELIGDGLSSFSESRVEKFKKKLSGWRNENRWCPRIGRDICCTVLSESKGRYLFAYRQDPIFASDRWGVLPCEHDPPGWAGSWYASFQEAFLHFDDL